MSNILDLSGQTFGRLFVDRLSKIDKNQRAVWSCICECGNIKDIASGSLIKGLTKSCGCYNKEKAKSRLLKHGLSEDQTPTYKTWLSMMARCYRHARYIDVPICVEWDFRQGGSFDNFLSDMGERPENTSLDRINNNLGYFKENCRWADDYLQAYNRLLQINNSTGRTGVYYREERKLPWSASISYKKKLISLGSFLTFEEAVNAREAAEVLYYGFIKQ